MKAQTQPGPEITLAQLPLGQSGIVTRLDVPPDVLAKLVEMGLGKGRLITFIQRVPLGDPMVIELMGYRLALRQREARGIWVVPSKIASLKQPGKKAVKSAVAGKAA